MIMVCGFPSCQSLSPLAGKIALSYLVHTFQIAVYFQQSTGEIPRLEVKGPQCSCFWQLQPSELKKKKKSQFQSALKMYLEREIRRHRPDLGCRCLLGERFVRVCLYFWILDNKSLICLYSHP